MNFSMIFLPTRVSRHLHGKTLPLKYDTVGLERILGCLEKMQTTEDHEQVDNCPSTVRYYHSIMPTVQFPNFFNQIPDQTPIPRART